MSKSTIATELTRILNAKAALITAINEKGGSLTSSSKLEDFASEVEDIQTGGGIDYSAWSGTKFARSQWSLVPDDIIGYIKYLKKIPDSFFNMCSNLSSFSIPEEVTEIEGSGLRGCGFTSITIPNSVTKLGTEAFSSNSKLVSITFPDSIKTIARAPAVFSYLLAYSNSLVSVTILSTTPPSWGANGLGITGSTNYTIYVPAESVDAYKADSLWSSVADKIQAIPTLE